jgi:hypothetical protein
MSAIKRIFLSTAAAIGLFVSGSAFGAVSLLFTDNDATPTATSVAPGGTFNVSVVLSSTSSASTDQVIGLQYFLQSSGPQAGIFTITNRTTPPSGDPSNPFSDFTNPNATVLAAGNATLNPRNNNDLGAVLDNVNSPKSNNFGNGTTTFNPALVANYTIAVSPSAAPGTYTLSFVGTASTPLEYTNPAFADLAFSAPTGGPLLSTFTVAIPEPASLMALGGVGLLLVRRRRRAA